VPGVVWRDDFLQDYINFELEEIEQQGQARVTLSYVARETSATSSQWQISPSPQQPQWEWNSEPFFGSGDFEPNPWQ
jgi:hypothetical protein